MAIRFPRTAVLFALAATACGGPVMAAPAADGEQAIVRFDDLNLSTDAGAAALHMRVAHAVRRVCGDVDQRDLSAVRQMEACRQVAIASAEPQVQLALSNARDGHQLAFNSVKIVHGF